MLFDTLEEVYRKSFIFVFSFRTRTFTNLHVEKYISRYDEIVLDVTKVFI